MTRSTLCARVIGVAAAAGAMLAVPAAASATELFYATTPTNQLISFTAQAPGAIRSSEPITGLAAAETIVGMDRRPATSQMYVLTSAGRVLVLDTDSGDTKVITPTPLALNGTHFGFDFSPIGAAIRVVSDTDINRRVNADSGAISNDTALKYAAGDPGSGKDPAVGAVAYTNSAFGGAAPASTELFGIDSATNTLVKQAQNEGTLTTVGALGQDAIEPVQFDIAGSNAKYAAFATSATSGVRLWTLNAAGLATATSPYPVIGAAKITSLATAGDVPNDTSAPVVSIGNYTTFRGIWLSRGLKFTNVCLTECTVTSTLRLGSTVVGTATTTMPSAASRVALIKLTYAGRKIAARSGRIAASLTLASTDLAGNKRTHLVKFSSIAGLNTAG